MPGAPHSTRTPTGRASPRRERIAAGTVYQANLCRVLEHDLDDAADLDGLDALLRTRQPGTVCRSHPGRRGRARCRLGVTGAVPHSVGERLVSSPIKGTATTADRLLPKDVAENVMIVDLVRNDLSRVCHEGTVDVEALCAVEPHPGLVHLVSTVAGRLRPGVGWADILDATFPPGSVSGAPKSSALTTIRDLERVPRGPYCGAIGWVDADCGEAELAVGIRTFWAERDDGGRQVLRFGTGAGITWGSDPDGGRRPSSRPRGSWASRRRGETGTRPGLRPRLRLARRLARRRGGSPWARRPVVPDEQRGPRRAGDHGGAGSLLGGARWPTSAARPACRPRCPDTSAPVDAGILLLGAADRREPPRRAPERGFTATRWGEYPSGGRASGKVGA